MIPGFSSLPMMMRKAGGVAASGRIKFTKIVSDANNYELFPIDIEIYTNITGYGIDIGLAAYPDFYSGVGLPFPYIAVLAFYDHENLLEYSYSSLTLGSTTFVSPGFYPGFGYIHSTTSGVVASFAEDVWYDFLISL